MDGRNDFPDRPWTVDEVAEYLQIKPRTVYDRVRNSGLPFVRIGGEGMRFIREDVDAWIRTHTAEAAGDAA